MTLAALAARSTRTLFDLNRGNPARAQAIATTWARTWDAQGQPDLAAGVRARQAEEATYDAAYERGEDPGAE